MFFCTNPSAAESIAVTQAGWQRGTEYMPRTCIAALANNFGSCRTIAIARNRFNAPDPKQLASMENVKWRRGASLNKSYFFFAA